jgi:hypothetical protein
MSTWEPVLGDDGEGDNPEDFPGAEQAIINAQDAIPVTIEASNPDNSVTDIRDLRVLIPPCRRAIDGPTAMASGSLSATLSDDEVTALVADATGELILMTHGESSFGYQLIPTARDPFYMAPVAWMTDLPRIPAADAAILSQAALNFYFQEIRNLKISETIKNEAVDWEYSRSANVIAAWLQYLISNRDKAVLALQTINVPMDTWVSTVAERDYLAAVILEPYVSEVGAPVPYVGIGSAGGFDCDFRFGTYG